MSETSFAELLKKEETSHVTAKESYGYQNIVDIENITRTWFQLMVNLNESPKVRSFFANEAYDAKSETWSITPTDYTRSFLTSGLVIYEATDVASGRVNTLVITEDSTQAQIDEIHHLSSGKEYEVVALVRWAGCGMKIPKNAKLSLNPNIVWPVLTVETKVNGEPVAIEIANSSNQIAWVEKHAGKEEQGKLMVTEKNFQGQAKGEFHIPGEINKDNIKLELPYTCASFDILTKIHLGNDEDELVIFTS